MQGKCWLSGMGVACRDPRGRRTIILGVEDNFRKLACVWRALTRIFLCRHLLPPIHTEQLGDCMYVFLAAFFQRAKAGLKRPRSC